MSVCGYCVYSALMSKMSLCPGSRQSQLETRLSSVEPRAVGPCGGFTAAYRCASDYHAVQFVDEVAWVCLMMIMKKV